MQLIFVYDMGYFATNKIANQIANETSGECTQNGHYTSKGSRKGSQTDPASFRAGEGNCRVRYGVHIPDECSSCLLPRRCFHHLIVDIGQYTKCRHPVTQIICYVQSKCGGMGVIQSEHYY